MFESMLAYLHQRFCGLMGGHDTILQFDDGRMFLRCQCGHESPGWDLNAVPPTQTAPTGNTHAMFGLAPTANSVFSRSKTIA